MLDGKAVYRRIHQRCAELGMSLSEASTKSGHSESWLAQVKDSGAVNTKTIHEIAKALDVPVAFFYQ